MEKYVVTGPSGWVGSALLGLLAKRMGPRWRTSVTCFGSREGRLQHPNGEVEVRALASITAADVNDATVFHLAYLTKDKLGELDDGAFLSGNLAIDDYLLGALLAGCPLGVFIASSGAARGVSHRGTRDLYGIAKLIQEDRFLDYCDRSKTRTIIGRIFNISGPHINKVTSYALSSFISQGIRSGRIVISSRSPVYRSYLSVEDLLTLILAEMKQPVLSLGNPVDLCGALVVELEDVADVVAVTLGLDPAKDIFRDNLDFDVADHYLGDFAQTRTLALKNKIHLLNFTDQVAQTVAYLNSRIVHSSSPDAPDSGQLVI